MSATSPQAEIVTAARARSAARTAAAVNLLLAIFLGAEVLRIAFVGGGLLRSQLFTATGPLLGAGALLVAGRLLLLRGVGANGGWTVLGLSLGAAGGLAAGLTGLAQLASFLRLERDEVVGYIGIPHDLTCGFPFLLAPFGLVAALVNARVLRYIRGVLPGGVPPLRRRELPEDGRATLGDSESVRRAAVGLAQADLFLGTLEGTAVFFLLLGLVARAGDALILAVAGFAGFGSFALLTVGRLQFQRSAEGSGARVIRGLLIAAAGAVLSGSPAWVALAVELLASGGASGSGPAEAALLSVFAGAPGAAVAGAHVFVILRHGPAIRAGLVMRRDRGLGPLAQPREAPPTGTGS